MPDQHAQREAPEGSSLTPRVEQLEQERRHLLAVIEILKEISGSLHLVDIVQAITRKLGATFGLDRCSIFLTERGSSKARLVASYEDPGLRNRVVDLSGYPELKRALQSGETVFISDAQADPKLKHIRGVLENRNVKTITVVPITWRGVVIGAIFLRTYRDGAAFSESDIHFCQLIGRLTASALRNAYRYEKLLKRKQEVSERASGAERERVALISYLKRLLNAFSARDSAWAEGVLPRASMEELDRLVDVAIAVLAEEGKGR